MTKSKYLLTLCHILPMAEGLGKYIIQENNSKDFDSNKK